MSLIKNVVSVFDGMSCGQIALNQVGIDYENYYASEIDKYAIQITNKNKSWKGQWQGYRIEKYNWGKG